MSATVSPAPLRWCGALAPHPAHNHDVERAQGDRVFYQFLCPGMGKQPPPRICDRRCPVRPKTRPHSR